jgi:hypothetical protein
VDNFVDKHPLTGAKASVYAGFNKLLKGFAKKYSFKINDLKNAEKQEKYNSRKISLAFSRIFFVYKMPLGVFAAGWQLYSLSTRLGILV